MLAGNFILNLIKYTQKTEVNQFLEIVLSKNQQNLLTIY